MTSSSLINKLSKDTNLTENERLEIISLITKQTEKVYGNKSNADKVGPKKNPSEYSDNPNAKYSLKNYYKHREELGAMLTHNQNDIQKTTFSEPFLSGGGLRGEATFFLKADINYKYILYHYCIY